MSRELPLLRLEDAADLLAVSVTTIEREIQRGNLRCVRVSLQGLRRVHPDDLAAYIQKRRNAETRTPIVTARGRRITPAVTERGKLRDQLRAAR